MQGSETQTILAVGCQGPILLRQEKYWTKAMPAVCFRAILNNVPSQDEKTKFYYHPFLQLVPIFTLGIDIGCKSSGKKTKANRVPQIYSALYGDRLKTFQKQRDRQSL